MKHFTIIIALFCTTVSSCKKWVTIDQPVTKLSASSVFENSSLATGAQLAIYNNMCSDGQSYLLSSQLGMLADELSNYSNDNILRSLYTNAQLSTNTYNPWLQNGGAYGFIYKANSVIEGLQKSNNIPYRIKDQLTGEALFIRAFWHFYLVNCFGAAPLITTTDYKANSLRARSDPETIYGQIINDLEKAKGLLNSKYVDESDTLVTTERVRPNKSAAGALLARVLLFTRKYSEAEKESGEIIGNSLYVLPGNLNDVFLANSSEAIWQLGILRPLGSLMTFEGNYFILLAAPGNSGSVAGISTVSPQLLNSFEPGDLRKTFWIDSVTTDAPMTTFYYPFKYQVYDVDHNINNRTEYSMVLRLGEQYLIRAESRAEQDNLIGALEDLNTIRHRAGLGDFAGDINDKEAVLAAILHERQVELFTEWGHRWLDLKRTGKVNEVMSVVTPLKGGIWNPDGHQQLFPIPQSEIQLDHNLTQNRGY